MKYAPLEIKRIACMIIVLKKSEKILVAPGFDLGTSHTESDALSTELWRIAKRATKFH